MQPKVAKTYKITNFMTKTATIQHIQTMGKQILPKGSNLWLYGSRARGDNRSDSDWDLLVFTPFYHNVEDDKIVLV